MVSDRAELDRALAELHDTRTRAVDEYGERSGVVRFLDGALSDAMRQRARLAREAKTSPDGGAEFHTESEALGQR